MLKRFLKARKAIAIAVLLIVTTMFLAPAQAFAADTPPPDDNNMITRLVVDLLDGVRYTFQKIGMMTVGEMVYNQKCTVDGWGSSRVVTCHPDNSRILGNTFSPSEWSGVTKVAVGIFGLFGTLLVIAAMLTGIQIAESGADERKRASGMEKLKNIGLVALMTCLVGPILWFIFDLNSIIVQLMGNIGGAVDFSQLFSGNGLTQVGKIMVGVFSIITEVSLNLVYVMRKFALMALIAISPVAIYCFIFESTRSVTKVWFQELLSNIAIQTVHAILIALFFQAYPASSGGASAFGALCFLMVLPPLTNLLRSVLTNGRASTFTGQGIAAAMTGVGILTGAGRALAGAGSVNLLGALGRTGGGALMGAGGFGGVANAVSQGSISQERMGQAAAMSVNSAPPPGTDGTRTGGSITQAAISKFGAGSDTLSRAAAYGTTESKNLLTRVQGIANGATKVVGVAGAAAGAIGGAGLALATGDASYIQAGATLGNRLGKLGSRAVVGGTLGAATVGSVAASGVVGAVGAARASAQTARAGGAPLAASALQGVKAGTNHLGGHMNSALTRFADKNFAHLTSPVERREAARYAISQALGGTIGGRIGQSLALQQADRQNLKDRQLANLPDMGTALEEYKFQEGDVVEYRAFPNRTDVYLNSEKIDMLPEGHPDATNTKPVYGAMQYTQQDKEGRMGWQRIEHEAPTPHGQVGPNVGEKVARTDLPAPQMVFGKGRGGLRR